MEKSKQNIEEHLWAANKKKSDFVVVGEYMLSHIHRSNLDRPTSKIQRRTMHKRYTIKIQCPKGRSFQRTVYIFIHSFISLTVIINATHCYKTMINKIASLSWKKCLTEDSNTNISRELLEQCYKCNNGSRNPSRNGRIWNQKSRWHGSIQGIL